MLQVGHIEQFNPALARVRPLMQDPRLIEAARAGGYTFRSTDIGVVLDLMIHDLDIALSISHSSVRSVAATGLSVMGEHEDVAQAQIEFASGCVANFSASRVSYQRHEMQIWSEHGQVEIDFATRRTIAVEPADALLDFDFHERDLTAGERQHLQKALFEELLPAREQEAPAQNALVEEQRDFVESVATGREPRVPGKQGLAAIAVAEQVLARIADHQWRLGRAEHVGSLRLFAAPSDRRFSAARTGTSRPTKSSCIARKRVSRISGATAGLSNSSSSTFGLNTACWTRPLLSVEFFGVRFNEFAVLRLCPKHVRTTST